VRDGLYRYTLLERPGTEELKGRLVVNFKRTRIAHRLAEGIEKDLKVEEMYAKRLSIKEFPGYTRVNISKADLDLIVAQQVSTWRSVLGAVKGVYVISDIKTGKLYVGSATGEGGLWARWSDYSGSGHGGNKELIALLKEKGKDYSRHFRFAILETADTKTDEKEIERRETHWKKVLRSKEHGYNAN
jgi:hypothetical protein